jgi:gamma-glutamyltranspeptidase / glutathione hydrolase
VLYRTAPLAPGESFKDHVQRGDKYLIATQGIYSTEAGVKMYQLGGNAADAATAVSFAISVERPQSTGIGGGGFLLFNDPNKKVPLFYDFREKAPAKSHSKIYLDKEGNEIPRRSLDGIFAAGVPGLVAGVLEFHQKHGKLPLKVVLAPAIELAQKGFKVYPELAKALKVREKVLASFPSSKKIFFKKGRVLKLGDHLIQKDLAKTINRIAKNGRREFYQGVTAQRILKTSRRYRGLLTQKDFNDYNVKMRAPVQGTYGEYDVFSMAPPSSGGAHVIQILNTVEPLKLGQYGVHHPKAIHYTASAMQQAFADRARYLGDMDFVPVPLKELTSKEYAHQILEKIEKKLQARKKEEVFPGKFKDFPPEHKETTHFTIMDTDGYVVSSTQTINGYFGSALVAEGTGIVLNNEMDDFATKVGASNLFGAVGGKNNLVEAGKRPLSSMSPTLVMKGNKPVLALGSPSGTRILTCVAQTILNYIEHKLPLVHALGATRYHHQWSPDEIRIGVMGLPIQTENELREMGYKLNHKNLGCRVQAIAWDSQGLYGISDPRGRGKVFGL